jgi:hypothetical protein
MRAKFRGARRVRRGPGVLNWGSSGSSKEASRALRFRRVEADAGASDDPAPPRRRVDMCDGVSVESSMVPTEVPRSDLIR